jgi:hypothetical protein
MTNQEHGNKGQESTGFVVKDRRRFDSQGTLRMQESENNKSNESTGGSTTTATILDRSYQPPQNETARPRVSSQESRSQQASHAEQIKSDQTSSRPAQRPTAAPVEEDEDDSEINFSSFIVSLATQASIQLGLLTPPPGMDASVDLDAAKQTIDILGLVERKTRGNLNDQEKNLLINILHELRIGYVQVMKSQRKM